MKWNNDAVGEMYPRVSWRMWDGCEVRKESARMLPFDPVLAITWEAVSGPPAVTSDFAAGRLAVWLKNIEASWSGIAIDRNSQWFISTKWSSKVYCERKGWFGCVLKLR